MYKTPFFFSRKLLVGSQRCVSGLPWPRLLRCFSLLPFKQYAPSGLCYLCYRKGGSKLAQAVFDASRECWSRSIGTLQAGKTTLPASYSHRGGWLKRTPKRISLKCITSYHFANALKALLGKTDTRKRQKIECSKKRTPSKTYFDKTEGQQGHPWTAHMYVLQENWKWTNNGLVRLVEHLAPQLHLRPLQDGGLSQTANHSCPEVSKSILCFPMSIKFHAPSRQLPVQPLGSACVTRVACPATSWCLPPEFASWSKYPLPKHYSRHPSYGSLGWPKSSFH